MNKYPPPLPCVFCFALLLFCVPKLGAQTNFQEPDEAYFLLRTLEGLYEQWPQNLSDAESFTSSTRELRKEALEFKVRAQASGTAREVASLFQTYVDVLDSYSRFLSDLGAIRKAARDNADKEEFSSGLKGGYAAGSTLAGLSNTEGVTNGEAAVASLIVGGITYAMDSWGKASKRDDAEKVAVQRAAQKIEDSFTEALAIAQQTAMKLADERGWKREEVGWELSAENANRVLDMYSKSDAAGLSREMDRQAQARPRDPYIRIALNGLQALQMRGNPPALFKLAEDSYLAKHLVPSNSAYSQIKLGCISQAAVLASLARDAELAGGANFQETTAISRRAVELWDESLSLQPSDPSGGLRAFRAFAKLANGDVLAAQKEASEVFELLKDDPDYLYGCACILSRSDDWDAALQFLSSATSSGQIDINHARTDHDLMPLRATRREQFDKIVNPQWSWKVTDDWVWDDVILKNDSSYPLTNIKFVVTLKKGTTTKVINLECAFIPAGQVHQWDDIVYGVEGTWDSASGEFTCDQNKK